MAEIVTIALILLFGTLCSALAYRLKVSNVFFLVLAGMIFAIFGFVDLGSEAIVAISQLALVMIVFDATSRLNFRDVLKYSRDSLKVNFVFLFLGVVFMSALFMLFFKEAFLIAALFSILMYGIDPAIALSVLKGRKDRIIEVLEIESIINTPITLILSIMILGYIQGKEMVFSDQIVSFLQQLFVPIGVGVAIGFIIVHIMKHNYFDELSHLMVITSSIVVYVLSELMHGSGVLGVTMFGLIFGNYHINHKLELEKFASIFANTLKILVFILLGTLIINYAQLRTFDDLIYGTILFLAYLVVRYVSVSLSIGKIDFKKKLFMTFNVPKGIDVAVVLLFIIGSGVKGIATMMNISLLFVLYSIVLSTVSSLFNKWYFGK